MKKQTLLFACLLSFVGISISQNVGIGIATPAGKLHIKGTSNISQLLVDANSPQTNDFPLVRLRNSLGKDLMWIHADDSTNVFIGLRAGRSNNLLFGGAIYNTFIGSDAGRSNTTAAFNTVIGSRAMYSNVEGGYNTASGYEALYANGGGDFNTAYGMNALYSNVRGGSGTAIGFGAMEYANNTTEPFTNTNVAVGFEAMRGSSNPSANTGIDNTALGFQALRSITTGYLNTATGTYAMFSNTTGGTNTASGYGALFDNIDGFNNTAFGSQSLYSNTTGSNNTAIGAEALSSILAGNDNTTIGYKASVSGDDISNATAIGSHAYAGSSNSVVIGSINGINGATANTNVGIGTATPNAKLHVSGTVKISDGTQGAGKILTSDATGLASWQPPPPPPPAYYQTAWICCNPWMTRNLDVATYRNGDPIPKVTDDGEWAALTTGAYCYYDNDSTTYAAIYGKLYNWYAVNDSRGLAPAGWHIPTDFEWTTLSSCLGGDDLAGGPMKEIGTTHWNTPNNGATNVSGFTGLPGGYRNIDGSFLIIITFGHWWSTTESSTSNAWARDLYFGNDNIFRGEANKLKGFSVRCLRD